MKKYPPGAISPRSIKPTNKTKNVLHKSSAGTSFLTTENAKSKVQELQKQIELKEQELNQLREAMANNNNYDNSGPQVELLRLQNAFDQVSKICESRLQPVINKYQQTQALYESKKYRVKLLHQAAKERDQAMNILQDRIDIITGELDSSECIEVKDLEFKELLTKWQKSHHEIEKIRFDNQFNSIKTKNFSRINDFIANQLKELTEKENQSNKHLNLTKQENESRLNRPQQIIDDEWIIARHTYDKLHIMLEDAKRSVQFLNETADQLSLCNKRLTEEINEANDDLLKVKKFLPFASHSEIASKTDGFSIGDLTVLQSHKDYSEIIVNVERIKTNSLKSALENLRKKVDEMKNTAKTLQKSEEDSKIEKENMENSLKKAQHLWGILKSKRMFADEEISLLKNRIKEQTEILDKINESTENAHKEYQKQQIIYKFNEEIHNLKHMNFDKFTTTISNLISIQNKL